tara:strand:+ start:105 stop:281 length:177 start_codon:yes stop_codon:yes gene_type:complete
MPFKGRFPFNPSNAKKLWDKEDTRQGFGSLYGGNQVSNVTKNVNDNTVSEDRSSEFPK